MHRDTVVRETLPCVAESINSSYSMVWAIAMVTFDVPQGDICPVEPLNHLIVFSQFLQQTLIDIVLWFLLDNSDVKCDLIAYFCVTIVHIAWFGGSYEHITPSRQGYILY